MKNVKLVSNVAFWEIAIFGALLLLPCLKERLIVGTLVNALLFLLVLKGGLAKGIVGSFLPSSMALAMGTLPFVFAPIIPLIIVGNCILVFVAHYLKERGSFAIFSAAVLKALFLWLTFSGFLSAGSGFFAILQLATALSGGCLAIIFQRRLR